MNHEKYKWYCMKRGCKKRQECHLRETVITLNHLKKEEKKYPNKQNQNPNSKLAENAWLCVGVEGEGHNTVTLWTQTKHNSKGKRNIIMKFSLYTSNALQQLDFHLYAQIMIWHSLAWLAIIEMHNDELKFCIYFFVFVDERLRPVLFVNRYTTNL